MDKDVQNSPNDPKNAQRKPKPTYLPQTIPKDGILPQYAHLKGMAENMPVIRKLLGLPEHGRIPTNTAIGRAVQRFVENSGQDVVR